MAMLDVDKSISGLARAHGSAHEIADQIVDFCITQAFRVRLDAKLWIENRMMIEDSWLKVLFVIGPCEPAGMGQLQPNKQIIRLGQTSTYALQQGLREASRFRVPSHRSTAIDWDWRGRRV